MILIACALPQELRAFDPSPQERMLFTGVGPVEAAIATARALATGAYTAVVNAGIAGIDRSAGRVGDAFVIHTETLADFGLEGGGMLTLPGGATLAETAVSDPQVVVRCVAAGLPSAAGLTVAQVTTTDTTAARLRARYAAAVESMEGFSVLRAAADAGIPAVEVRGISNFVGDRDRGEWDFGSGTRAAVAALRHVLTILKESR